MSRKRCAIGTFLCVAALAAGAARARTAEGVLDLIITPNNGVPALTQPGAAIAAELTAQASVQLVGEQGVFPLEAIWSEMPGGRTRALCAVPESMPPGVYALEARADARTDRNARAVYIFDRFPDYYVVAHLTDTHIGSNRHARASEAILADLIHAVNESDATFAVLTGDLTDDGEPEQFRSFLSLLDTCRVPTFVQPGNHDRQGLNYERFFGPLTYRFRFGLDGFLAFDTKDYLMADELGAQDADLQVFRRELKPCRWTVGLTHRYEQMMGMRSQITLFIDNPLDAVFFGHFHRENSPEEAAVPWGTTHVVMTPAAIDGYLRFIDMTVSGIRPRPPEQPAAIE